MKFSTLFAAALCAVSGVAAVDVQKHVVITYASNTPDSVVNQAKDAIVKAGGIITHEYNLIKGFAATAGETVLTSVKTMGEKYNALVEEDREVSVAL